jgi:hypothetical protein
MGLIRSVPTLSCFWGADGASIPTLGRYDSIVSAAAHQAHTQIAGIFDATTSPVPGLV